MEHAFLKQPCKELKPAWLTQQETLGSESHGQEGPGATQRHFLPKAHSSLCPSSRDCWQSRVHPCPGQGCREPTEPQPAGLPLPGSGELELTGSQVRTDLQCAFDRSPYLPAPGVLLSLQLSSLGCSTTSLLLLQAQNELWALWLHICLVRGGNSVLTLLVPITN